MAVANPFAGMTTAKVSGSGNYLSPDGEYIVEIDRLEFKDLFKGGAALIVEFDVITSNNEKDPAGAKRSWFQQKNASFDGAVLEFLYAMLKVDHKNDAALAASVQAQSPALMAKALYENAFKGQKVRVTTKHKITKEAKKDFTVHVWTPFEG